MRKKEGVFKPILRFFLLTSLFVVLFILPVFADSCSGGLSGYCHGTDGPTSDGNLLLEFYSTVYEDMGFIDFVLNSTNVGFQESSVNVSIKKRPNQNPLLCAIEGLYKVNLRTAILSVEDALTIDAYIENSQDSKLDCQCIQYATGIDEYGDPNVLPLEHLYNWSDIGKNFTGFGCCGPTTLGNGLGEPTSCKLDGSQSVLCDSSLSKYSNIWHIASQDTYCAYVTGCYNGTPTQGNSSEWVWSNNRTWEICSKEVNPDTYTPISVEGFGEDGETLIFNSFGCFNNLADEDENHYKVYECENYMSQGTICQNEQKPTEAIEMIVGSANLFYVNLTSGPLFCLYSGEYGPDLDINDFNHYKTCDLDDFKWTGSKCCQDIGDVAEFYNDANQNPIHLPNPETPPARKAGCFNSTIVYSGKRLSDISSLSTAPKSKYVLNNNGTFFGCNLSDSYYVGATGLREGTSGNYIGDFLIDSSTEMGGNNVKICSVVFDSAPGKDFMCEPSGWTDVNLADFGYSLKNLTSAHLGEIRPDRINNPAYNSSVCLLADQCWDGKNRIPSFETALNPDTDSIFGPDSTRERTIDGKTYVCTMAGQEFAHWEEFTGKKDEWDFTAMGICPSDQDCLVDREGTLTKNDPADYTGTKPNPLNPRCINSGEYIDDHYCQAGQWITRTKLVSEQLLANAGINFTLHCDNATVVFNKLDYQVNEGAFALNAFSEQNPACVLKDSSKMIFGLSLNKDVSETGILELSGSPNTACSASSANYASCGANSFGWNIYYNAALKSLIFTKDSFSESASPSKIEDVFGTASIFSIAKTIANHSSNAMEFLNLTHDYSRMYISNKGKPVFAVREQNYYLGKMTEYFVVKYSGYTFDVCNYVEDYLGQSYLGLGGSNCGNSGNDYYVFSFLIQDTEMSEENINTMAAWRDLTAKIRPKN